MIFRQYLDTDPVAASYLFGCGGKAVGAVVDPLGDLDRYLRDHGILNGIHRGQNARATARSFLSRGRLRRDRLSSFRFCSAGYE